MIRPARLLPLAAALALAGCALGGPRTELAVYAPPVRVAADPAWPAVDWQLAIGTPEANQMLDSPRIVVRPTPERLQTYKGARWADAAPQVMQTALLAAFEDSGKVPAVSRIGIGRRDFGLFTELRAFESVYVDGAPQAVIELQARLVHLRGDGVVAAKRFRVAVPSQGTEIEAVVAAFGQAMAQVSADIVGWTLAEGQQALDVSEAGSAGK